ncbi:MAG: type II secretion system F family protein [Planctomycetes bacterium]|nr:type II secretion system F family protein [Planctomycetota bacterium]
MKSFTYKSRNSQGKIVTGTVEAETENEAVSELRRRGLTVVHLGTGKGSGTKGGSSFFSLSFSRLADGAKTKVKLKSAELVVFTRQLSTMVSSGIPLVESLEILEEQTQNRGFKRVLNEIVVDVRAGKDLSQSLSRHPKIFKDIYVNMVRAGEASGQLDTVLDRLAEYQEASEALKGEIKSAMTYPVVSLTMVLGITIFLLVFIIPKFEEMFTAMEIELPFITSALLATAKFLQRYFLVWIAAIVIAVVGVIFYFRSPKGQRTLDWLILKLPVFGTLFAKVAISRFSRTFATLIKSGVPILGALEIVQTTAGNVVFSDAIAKASESVRQGETLGEPLARSGVFPPMVTKMVAIGERSGALEALLEKISEFYDQQVSATVKSLTALIEPIMIGAMGFLVGGMVMAIFLPIFKMIGSMASR